MIRYAIRPSPSALLHSWKACRSWPQEVDSGPRVFLSRPPYVAPYVAPYGVAKFVYIDETGSSGRTAKRQPYLTVAAAIVDETMVQQLRAGLQSVASDHLQWVLAEFELHGHEIWGGNGYWTSKAYDELIAAYEAAMSIDKAALHTWYNGGADDNAFRLALQLLLEKVDAYGSSLKILVADEAREQEVRAVKMVQGMQNWSWGGEVPGRQLKTIIDSLHFVSSHDSAGVQTADLVAFVLQRRPRKEAHPNTQAAMNRLSSLVDAHTRTWRQPWPCGADNCDEHSILTRQFPAQDSQSTPADHRL